MDFASGLRNVNVLRWFDVSGMRIRFVAPTRAYKCCQFSCKIHIYPS